MGVDDWDFPKPTIDDPEDKKPEGYDDIPSQIPDPDATKPDDWDDEDDGEWGPPLIDNPDFQEGVQLAAYDSMYVGYELWIVNNGTIFDNILVTDDLEYAKAQGEKLWRPTSKGEKAVKEEWDKVNKPADDLPSDDEDVDEDEAEDDEPEKDEL